MLVKTSKNPNVVFGLNNPERIEFYIAVGKADMETKND